MEKTEWQLYWEFIKYRKKKPASSIAYWLYFLLVIVVLGIFGSLVTTYTEFYLDKKTSGLADSISYNLTSFAIVLMCTSAIDLVFIKIDIEDEQEREYEAVSNGIVMTGVAMLLISIFAGFFIFTLNLVEGWRLFICILLCLLALFSWWITNAKSLSVLRRDTNRLNNFIGNPQQPLEGSTEGFNV